MKQYRETLITTIMWSMSGVYLWREFLCVMYVGSIPAGDCFWQPDLVLIQWSTDNNHCAAILLFPDIPCYTLLPCYIPTLLRIFCYTVTFVSPGARQDSSTELLTQMYCTFVHTWQMQEGPGQAAQKTDL